MRAMADHAALLARTHAFTRAIGDRIASRPIDHLLGHVIANDAYPASYSMNFLRVEGPQPDLGAARLEAAVAAAMDGIGRTHLQAIVEDHAAGARVAAELRDHGWEVVELLTMAQLGSPRRTVSVQAAVVPWEVARPLVLRNWQRDPAITEEWDAAMLTDRRSVLAAATHLRHLVAPVPPAEPGGYADLYSDGRTAQVEMVNTLTEFRNQGLASAVVLHGARLARDEGHDLVFLIADAADWPYQLYERLGFEEIGRYWELSKDR